MEAKKIEAKKCSYKRVKEQLKSEWKRSHNNV